MSPSTFGLTDADRCSAAITLDYTRVYINLFFEKVCECLPDIREVAQSRLFIPYNALRIN